MYGMNWDEEYDVVVIGSGISGLSGGLTAAKEGARTIVLEKAKKLGGSTSYSYGLLWVGNNRLARAKGYEDSREEVHTYMNFLGGHQTDQIRLNTYIDQSVLALDYFKAAGVKFRVTQGIHDHYLGIAPGAKEEGRTIEAELISGKELGMWQDRILLPDTTPFRVNAEEAVAWGGVESFDHWDTTIIGQREKKDVRGMGVGLVTHFVKCLTDYGGNIQVGIAAESLVMDGKKVAGVTTNKGRRLKAKQGVILATGGYESNHRLVEAFEEWPQFETQFPASVTGDGLVLGAEIGAAIRVIHNNLATMLGFSVGRKGDPTRKAFRVAGIIELCSPHTLVVNTKGNRFADESYFQSLATTLREYDCMAHEYKNLPCFLIFDHQFVEKFAFAGIPSGSAMPSWVTQADTLRALAESLSIAPEGLSATVQRFNSFAKDGVDRDYGRGKQQWMLARATKPTKNRSLGTIGKAPFYGIELKPTGVGSAGLTTNEFGQVMHIRGMPIEGLYASGNVSAHTEYGVGYQAGYSLTSGMTFGWLAAKHMLTSAAKEQ